MERTTDASDFWTGVAPYWTGTDEETGEDVTVTLPEGALYASSSETAVYQRVVPLDLSGYFEEKPDETQLRIAAQAVMEEKTQESLFESIDVSFVTSDLTEGIAALKRLALCDTLSVIHPRLGVSATAKIVSVTYDVVLERYTSMTLGSIQPMLDTTLTAGLQASLEQVRKSMATRSRLTQVKNTLQTEMQQAVENATRLLTGGDGGYVVTRTNANGEPIEHLYMNTDDMNTATQVLRINKNGIGFSKTGIDGPYTSAWTLDGTFIADWIQAGTLNANVIRAGVIQDTGGTNYWNLETGDFRLAPSAQIGSSSKTVGDTVVSTDVQYGNSDSASTAPSTWTSNAQWQKGKVLWTRTKLVYADGTSGYTDASVIAGAEGMGVSSVTEQYILTNSNTTSPSANDSGWSDAQPAWSKGKYYWTRSRITWSDGSVSYTTPALAMALTSGNQSTNDLDEALNQQAIFNRLTNNGQTQGIFMDSGKLYLNATYIRSGTLEVKKNNREVFYVNVDTGAVRINADSLSIAGSAAASQTNVSTAISDYDTGLTQAKVFNKLTNNGVLQGLFMQDGKLYINAAYITTGVLKDVQGRTSLDLTTGELKIGHGTIDIYNFETKFGFYVGPYGDVAIGSKPSNMSSFENNKTAFQINNWGTVKLDSIWHYYESSSGYRYKSGQVYSDETNGYHGVSISGPDGYKKLAVTNQGVTLWSPHVSGAVASQSLKIPYNWVFNSDGTWHVDWYDMKVVDGILYWDS